MSEATLTRVPVWQHEPWQRAQAARRRDALGHALLISGPDGSGKRHFCEALAASLLCEQVADDGTACGGCRSCRQLLAGSQPNRRRLEPLVDEKTGKTRRDISIEQVRELGDWLTLASHYGQSRVAIVAPADALNLNGVNALLKTIEEPPAGTHLLLVSSRPLSLPATLRSRCQQVRIAAPAAAHARAWLAEHGRQRAAQLADDDPLLHAPFALMAEDGDEQLARRDEWQQGLMAVAIGRREPLGVAAGVARQREEAAGWIATLQRLLGRLMRATRQPGADPELSRLAVGIQMSQLLSLIDEAAESQRRLSSNIQPQLAVESLMIGWWRVTRGSRRPPRTS